MSTMTELSQAAVERIMKKAGAGRISSDATETLAVLMDEYGAGRKTLRGSDIRIAAEIFK
jgi:histone H3/H4